MCQDCNPLESNTGVIHYSGPDLVICNGNTITNGELLTSVIAKIDNCIGALQFELDITGLIENSPCINLTKTSLQTVLQSILDTESAYCTQLQTLNTQITNLQNQVNNFPGNKVISITACDPSRVQVIADNTTQKTFKINGLIPPKTILPYFGALTDFSPTGLGLSNGPTAGWAIANGQSHTINGIVYTTINAIGTSPNDLGRYIKYGPDVKLTNPDGSPLGNNEVKLDVTNIPSLSFTTTANFTVTGTTDESGRHTHKLRHAYNEGPNTPCPAWAENSGDDPCTSNGLDPGTDSGGVNYGQIGYSGLHSHQFTGTGTGSFVGNTINNDIQSISNESRHIQAIPIQWLGC